MLPSCITDSNDPKTTIAGSELPIIYDGRSKSNIEFSSAVAFQNSIFIPTYDGVWEFLPANEEWKAEPLLKGKKVTAIYSHTGLNELFIAVEPERTGETSLFTYDGNKVSVVRNVPKDPTSDLAERFYFFTERPGHPDELYANLSGEMIAVSKDRGNKLFRNNYESESYFGYPCLLGFIDTK